MSVGNGRGEVVGDGLLDTDEPGGDELDAEDRAAPGGCTPPLVAGLVVPVAVGVFVGIEVSVGPELGAGVLPQTGNCCCRSRVTMSSASLRLDAVMPTCT